MSESLGSAVLTLLTDTAKFFAGIDAAEKKGQGLKASFTKVEKAIAGFLTVGAITAVVKSYTDFTSHMVDLSAKTGIGTEALQRLKFAAEQNGSSLDKVTTAVTKLGINLAGGNKNAVGALQALGLSLDTIRAMEPDKAFTTIGDAIAKIPDPMDRAKLAMDLFGKAGAELLPMMRGNLSETAAAADRLGIVMNDSAVQAGDKFGDTLDALMSVGQAVIAQVLGPMIPGLTAIALWMGENIPKAFTAVRGSFDWFIGKLLELKVKFEEFIIKIVELGSKVPWLGKQLGATDETLSSLRASLQVSKDTAAAFAAETAKVGEVTVKTGGTLKSLKLDYDGTAKASKDAEKAAKDQAKARDEAAQKERALINELAVLNMNAEAARMKAIEDQLTAERALNNELAVLRMNHVAAEMQATAALAEADRQALNDMLQEKFDQEMESAEKSKQIREEQLAHVKQTFEAMATNISQNLAAALLHAQSFKDAFVNIWNGLKSSVLNVLSELLESFVKNFLAGMLNSLVSSQGSFTSGFSSMLSGFSSVLNGLGKQVSAFVSWAAKAIASVFSGGGGGSALNLATSTGASAAGTAAGIGGSLALGATTAGIGLAAFGVYKGIKAWMGKKEHMSVNDIRDDFFNEHGGLKGVNEAAQGAGDSGLNTTKAIFAAKTKTDFEKAIGAWKDVTGKGIGELASGGLVMRPTLSMIGERGPEAVIPLDRLQGHSGPLIFQVNGKELARIVGKEIMNQLRTHKRLNVATA